MNFALPVWSMNLIEHISSSISSDGDYLSCHCVGFQICLMCYKIIINYNYYKIKVGRK
jgi:hypothetical protein